jgi:hypothetical protein
MKPTPRRSPRGGCFVGPKFYPGGQFLPATGQIVPYDEARIQHELAYTTLNDEVYARAMHATLSGSVAVRHRMVLRSRRMRTLVRMIAEADAAGDLATRNRLHQLHQATLQGQLAMAGC